jgi:hypothetical protein
MLPEQARAVPFTVPFTIENDDACRNRYGRETVTWLRTLETARRRRFDASRISYMIYSTAPEMRLDAVVGGEPDWDGWGYIEDMVRLATSPPEKQPPPAELEPRWFVQRLQEEALRQWSVLKLQTAVNAWARKP